MKSELLRPQEILAKAAYLFRIKGYPATSIRDIGNELGVTSAALYYHFRSKDDILLSVMLDGLAIVRRRVEAAMEKAKTPMERIRVGLREHVLTCLEHQDYAAVIFQEIRYLSGVSLTKVIEARDGYEDLWAATLESGRQAGCFRPNVDLHLLRLFGFGAMNWVTVWYREDGAYSPEKIADSFFEQMVDGVLSEEYKETIRHLYEGREEFGA